MLHLSDSRIPAGRPLSGNHTSIHKFCTAHVVKGGDGKKKKKKLDVFCRRHLTTKLKCPTNTVGLHMDLQTIQACSE